MVNYAFGLDQSETGKYFEWIIDIIIGLTTWLFHLKFLTLLRGYLFTVKLLRFTSLSVSLKLHFTSTLIVLKNRVGKTVFLNSNVSHIDFIKKARCLLKYTNLWKTVINYRLKYNSNEKVRLQVFLTQEQEMTDIPD